MAYIEMVTKGNGQQVAEVFVKGKELLKVLNRERIYTYVLDLDLEYCLTFQQNEEEKEIKSTH